ncbi:hypothetical protein PH4a_13730 [Proteus hauseri]|nr:hypothetical protein PH4a_13730 [Proteus hauseri]
MKTTTELLFEPVITENLQLRDNGTKTVNIEDNILIIRSEKQSLILVVSYFIISFAILFSLFMLNNKHTLLLLSLQVSFFMFIPLFFKSTRIFLKEAISYLMR